MANRQKPSTVEDKFYIDISYPFWTWRNNYGEGHCKTMKTAEKNFDAWVETLKTEGKTAVVRLVEIKVKTHRVVVVSAGQITELQTDNPVWDRETSS
jgi:hypothetical protein